MGLPHDQIELFCPRAIRLTEGTVLQPIGGGSLVFLPQQQQGDALAFALLVHDGPVGHGTVEGGGGDGP